MVEREVRQMRKMTTYLKRWLKDNGFEGIKVREDVEFLANITEEIIYYAFCEDDEADKMFYQFGIDEGLALDCGSFVLSFFHELGHIMTDDLLSEKALDRCEKIKAEIETMTDYRKANLKYFALDDEITATRWAIDYINDNADRVEKFAIEIEKIKKSA